MRHAVLALLIVGCTSDPQPPPPPSVTAPPAPAPIKLAPAADTGSCTLTASGALTAEATSPGGKHAVSSKYWLSDAEHGAGDPGLLVNCTSKDLRLSIVTRPDATVPFGPKTYKIAGKTGDLVILGGTTATSLSDFSGTLDVTEFDGKHVAGTIVLSAKRAHGGGTVKLAGHFDFACAGYGNCMK